MAIEYGWQNRTVIGHHQKDSNTLELIEKDLPILTKESDALFLLTRDQFFSISTPQISNVLTNYLKYNRINNQVRVIANILLMPGLFIAVGYLLRYLGVLEKIEILNQFISSNIADILFGVSIFNVFILWYDYFKDKSHPVRLPKAQKIPLNDLEEIKTTGIKFGRYAHLEAINFVNEYTLDAICNNTKNEQIDTSSLFTELFVLPEIQEIFRRADIKITEEIFSKNNVTKETLPKYSYTAIRSIIIYALNEALLTSSTEIEPKHLILALLNVFPVLRQTLSTQRSSIDILREVIRYQSYEKDKLKRAQHFNPNVAYYRKGGIAKDWVYGYTYILNHFTKNVNEQVIVERDIYGIGHDDEIEALISVLGKVSNRNALFVGEPGVGKSSIVMGIAQRINSGDVPLQLKDKRILKFDINGLIAQSSKEQNLEGLVLKAMNELENAKDVILYIDEMQELIPSKANESGHSIAGILLPYILNSKFPILGTVNYADYKKYFYSMESLRQAFTNIEIKEISAVDALQILETKVSQLERNFNIYITFPALISAVELAQRYNKERKLPSSAVQLIEEACSWAQTSGVRLVTGEHVSKVLSNQKGIPIGSVDPQDSTKLMKLEENMKRKIIGQEDAIQALVEALRRAHVDIRNPNKPIGTYLFLGPTGVGKTHISKVLAEEYFGSANSMIRVDMSEYKEIESVEKFLGGVSDSSILGRSSTSLVDKIKSNPYTVVLFDEMEKAHPQILDLFLQIFDEGRLTSTLGETVDFTHSIIICTSNIGSLMLLETLNDRNVTWQEAKDRAMIELKQAIKPELLNRYDKVLVFHPHDIQNLSQISELLLAELAQRLTEKSITLKWGNLIPQLIASKANDPGLGARPIKRYIQDNIEGNIAKEMIEGRVTSGQEITVKESWIV
ncbi:ATP-dependent Clp protease ATP-binding subunit [Candidatus Dojkabacteria bacterium]|uniref:ATP-dependent Clp protease ATP-binding subunit n=1 Tax=Candidatus Dojkabacteria bacterium TaxID=2099670 RepID=A0A847ESE8_9BACT|nr:ATP-dependent Clp protease ATP-binding subunit [Candidatus Dojkabacteria bacterium]